MTYKIAVVTESPATCQRTWPAVKHIINELKDEDVEVTHLSVLQGDPKNGKQATKTEMRSADNLMEDLSRHKYVILVGNVPLQFVTGKAGISKLRGRPFKQGRTLYLPMNNPSILFHDPNQEVVMKADLELAHSIMEFGGIPEEKRLSIRIVTDREDFEEMLEDLSGTVSYDIETNSLNSFQTHIVGKNGLEPAPAKITAFGFGTKRNQWILGINQPQAPLSMDQVLDWMDELTERLDDCMIVTHNGKFDMLWSWVHFGVKWEMSFDTMLAHFLLDENSRHGLKYLAQVLLGAPDWEVDLDTKKGAGSFTKQAKYLAHDLYYTRELRMYLGRLLNKEPEVKDVFNLIMMPSANMFVEIEYDGVFIDTDKFEDAEAFLREQYDTALGKLKSWEPKGLLDKRGRPARFNWGSPKQLGELLYDKLKLPVIEKTKAGGRSCSESVLKRLAHPMVSDLLSFREAKQQLSFFIDGWKPYLHERPDGFYLHPSFKLHGTVTGRLSCENPNLQQVPRDKRIRTLITAPEGWTLIECDLSQVELRIAAELSGERKMLDAFQRGIDVHWLTATSELERGGGGQYVEDIYRTVGLFLVSIGLQADRASAEILLNLWKAEKKGPITSKVLQSCSSDWSNQGSGSWERGSSKRREESLLERWRTDMGKEVSEEVLRAVRVYASSVSSPQGRKPVKQSDLKFGDAMQVLSCIGPSIAQELWDGWKELRKKAKAVGFGYLYGMWWRKFKDYARDSYGVTLTDKEAEASRNAFFGNYADLPDWHKRQRKFANRHGYVPTLTGRKRRLPDAMNMSLSEESKSARKAAERQAINSPVQSYANDHNLMSALQLRKEYSRKYVRICGTVHDAILLRVRNDKVEEVYTRLLQIMSSPELLVDFGIELSVPIEADGSIGPWGAGVSLDKWKGAQSAQKKKAA